MSDAAVLITSEIDGEMKLLSWAENVGPAEPRVNEVYELVMSRAKGFGTAT